VRFIDYECWITRKDPKWVGVRKRSFCKREIRKKVAPEKMGAE